MAIVIRNDNPQGRFFRYKVNGLSKSVWIDGFSEVLIEELKDNSSMLNKFDKAKQERIENISNQNTIAEYLFVRRARTFKNVSDTLRWKPTLINLKSGYNAFVFNRDGRKYVFTLSPDQTLSIGAELNNSELGTLENSFDGTYLYNNFNYTIQSGIITSINQNGVEPTTSLSVNLFSSDGSIRYQRFFNSNDVIHAVGTQFYVDEELTNTWNVSGTFKYDVPDTSVNYFLNLTNGEVVSNSNYTSGGVNVVNASGNTATTISVYALSTQNIDEVGAQWYSDAELLQMHNTTGVYIDFSQEPNRYITVFNGEVISAGDIDWSSVPITYQSWSVKNASLQILTIYTQQGQELTTIGVNVYANSDGTGAPENGDYTYENRGTQYTIGIKSGIVDLVNIEAGGGRR